MSPVGSQSYLGRKDPPRDPPSLSAGNVSVSSGGTSGASKTPELFKQAEEKMDVYVAMTFYGNGLPFNLAEEETFKLMLRQARYVSKEYKPPKREALRTSLLDECYKTHQEKDREVLLKDAPVCGLGFQGDGASVMEVAYVNVLCSGVHRQISVQDIVDCTDHLQGGWKKDAKFVAESFIQPILDLDPHGDYVDFLMLDGADVCKKAQEVLAAKFPMMTFGICGTHVASNVFKQWSRNSAVRRIADEDDWIYQLFGGRVQHLSSFFRKQVECFERRTDLGLMKPDGTRFAGLFLRMQQTLRTKNALRATVHSNQFILYKLAKKILHVPRLIQSDQSFQQRHLLLKSTVMVMKISRMADSNRPHMDKLQYLVLKTDEHLHYCATFLNNEKNFPKEYVPMPDPKTAWDDNDGDDEEDVHYDEASDDEDEVQYATHEQREKKTQSQSTPVTLRIACSSLGGKRNGPRFPLKLWVGTSSPSGSATGPCFFTTTPEQASCVLQMKMCINSPRRITPLRTGMLWTG